MHMTRDKGQTLMLYDCDSEQGMDVGVDSIALCRELT